jgi:hypothetical protein
MLEAIPRVLAPTGRALLFSDLALGPDRPDPADGCRSAVGRGAIDLFLFQQAAGRPEIHALQYAMVKHPDLGAACAESAVRQREHYEALGVERFVHALVLLQRAGDRAPITATVGVTTWNGLGRTLDEVVRGIERASADDEALLAARLRLPEDSLFREERSRPAPSDEVQIEVYLTGARAGRSVELDRAQVALLDCLEAAPSVAEGIDAFAELCGQPAEEMRVAVLGFVRQSLQDGLLIVAG